MPTIEASSPHYSQTRGVRRNRMLWQRRSVWMQCCGWRRMECISLDSGRGPALAKTKYSKSKYMTDEYAVCLNNTRSGDRGRSI
jgi:hypothetical protein